MLTATFLKTKINSLRSTVSQKEFRRRGFCDPWLDDG